MNISTLSNFTGTLSFQEYQDGNKTHYNKQERSIDSFSDCRCSECDYGNNHHVVL